jgi:hypothetical protein
VIRTLRSNYRYWRDAPTREFCVMLECEAFSLDFGREVMRALEHKTLADVAGALKRAGVVVSTPTTEAAPDRLSDPHTPAPPSRGDAGDAPF